MANYYAVFRVQGCALPSTLSWECYDVREAIDYLCKQARVADTTGFAAYEIMEVVGLRQYKSIALKEESGRINVTAKKEPTPLQADSKEEQAPLTLDEEVYERYTVSAL